MIFIVENDNLVVLMALLQHVETIATAKGSTRILIKDGNNLVTKYCLENNIEFAAYGTNRQLRKLIKEAEENKVYVYHIFGVLKVFYVTLFLRTKIFFWSQGLAPEESFHNKRSVIKKNILSLFEWMALLLSDYIIMVTNEMYKFYQRKYPFISDIKYIVVPCQSRLNHRPEICRKENSYLYLGGMSSWQNFDLIVQLMNVVCERNEQINFIVATGELDKGKKIIEQYASLKLKNCIELLTLKDRTAVEEMLNSVQYGLIWRDSIALNHVASPIKVAEYLSCGVNIIMNYGLLEFVPLIQSTNCGVCIKDFNEAYQITDHVYNEAAALQAYKDYYDQNVIRERFQQILF